MRSLARLIDRIVPALLMASGVTLLAAGLLSYTEPVLGDRPIRPSATVAQVAERPDLLPSIPGASSDPAASSMTPGMTHDTTPGTTPETTPGATPETTPGTTPETTPRTTPGTTAGTTPDGGATPGTSPAITSSPSVIAQPTAPPSFLIPGVTPSAAAPSIATPRPTLEPTKTPVPTTGGVATRVTIPSQQIDLPIISRQERVPGQGPDLYPPCDVALFHDAFAQPGSDGSTYLYAHAREGMFLPLLEASEQQDGAELLGALVEVYTADDRLYVYEIFQVKRHALDFSLALSVPSGEQRVVLQTSEGPRGTVPKLQVAARLISELPATREESRPSARPVPCYDA
ncbi:MAG: sortase [Chloroflexota bacterium]|nr:sortase [Chloroflexota bacterium]